MTAPLWRTHRAYVQERETSISDQLLSQAFDPRDIVQHACESAGRVIAIDKVWRDVQRFATFLSGPELDASKLTSDEYLDVREHNRRVSKTLTPDPIYTVPNHTVGVHTVSVGGGGGGGGGKSSSGAGGYGHVYINGNAPLSQRDMTYQNPKDAPVTREEISVLMVAMKAEIIQQVCDELQRIEATIREMLG